MYCRAGQGTDEKMTHEHSMLGNQATHSHTHTRTHTHTHTHTHTPHTHTHHTHILTHTHSHTHIHSHTLTHTHTHIHTHTHTHTHTQYLILIAYPLPQWLQECASMFPHTHIAFCCASLERWQRKFVKIYPLNFVCLFICLLVWAKPRTPRWNLYGILC